MNEKKKTMMFGVVALALMFLAFITTPSKVKPDAFLDQGELFFPDFQDPNEATSLEVIGYNKDTGEATPFKVVFNEGQYSIPSHYDYPADGKERLAKTAAGVIGIKKDDFRSNNIADHEACNVIDPMDESSTALTGRGTRVTLKGANDQVLADFIVGKKVPAREGFRFVRLPDQKRVYSVRMDIDLSTRFGDWIDNDLMMVEKDNITQVTIKNYSINERSGVVNQRGQLTLRKDGSNWQINNLPGNKEVNTTKVDELLKSIDELKIVGVRPKPAGISTTLKKLEEDGAVEITQADYNSLRGKGYFFSGGGNLVSNEGEMQIKTSEGVLYTLRFGEVAYGSGADVSAGLNEGSENATQNQTVADNRYLFISTTFDSKTFTEPAAPRDTTFLAKADSLWSNADRTNKGLYDAYNSWKAQVKSGETTTGDLSNRFANWYYVISNASFKKLKLKREDLIKDKS